MTLGWFDNGIFGKEKNLSLISFEGGIVKKFHKLLTFSFRFANLAPTIAFAGTIQLGRLRLAGGPVQLNRSSSGNQNEDPLNYEKSIRYQCARFRHRISQPVRLFFRFQR